MNNNYTGATGWVKSPFPPLEQKQEEIISWTSWVKGPRCYNLTTQLKQICYNQNIEIDIITEKMNTSFIEKLFTGGKEFITFTAKGEYEKIRQLKIIISNLK